jgi:diguanylate cyclase (GGDEF)-like protein
MGLPPLDLPTLCVVSALVIAFAGVMLLAARGPASSGRPLAYWGVGMLAGSLGIVLLSLEPYTALPVRPAGNAVLLLSVALGWTGARAFEGRPARPVLLLGGSAGWLLANAMVGGAAPRLVEVLAYLAGAAYTLAAAAELWRGRYERLRSRRTAVAVLVLHSVVYLGQSLGSMADPIVFLTDDASVALLIEGLLHTVALAFLLLALMKERAEAQSRAQLLELATRDALTGLANRRLFDQAIRREVRVAARAGAPLSLLMIDVDHFKQFNDGYGHKAGDACLKAVAAAIDAAAQRSGDLAARYGGEEFAMLLPATEATGAAMIGEAVRSAVAGLRIAHARAPRGVVTVSVGVAAIVPGTGETEVDGLIVAADEALYAAKRAGRNRVAGLTESVG